MRLERCQINWTEIFLNSHNAIIKGYHNGFLDGLLNLHALSGNGLIQFPLKGQEVHVGLRLWDQVSDLKSQ